MLEAMYVSVKDRCWLLFLGRSNSLSPPTRAGRKQESEAKHGLFRDVTHDLQVKQKPRGTQAKHHKRIQTTGFPACQESRYSVYPVQQPGTVCATWSASNPVYIMQLDHFTEFWPST